MICFRQDNKTRLFKYEGGMLKEDGILEGNKGPVTAIAISPDASKLVSGDVRIEPPGRVLIPGRDSHFHSQLN